MREFTGTIYPFGGPRPRTWVAARLLAVVGAGWALAVCGGDGGGPTAVEGTPVEVVFANHESSELPIHILGPDEDFDASNRLEPGAERTVDVVVGGLLVVEFRAGRNEVVLDTLICVLTGEEEEGAFVLWFGDGVFFRCEGALESA